MRRCGSSDSNEYQWGFGIKRYYARELDIPITEKVTHIPSMNCIYTVMVFGDKGTFQVVAFKDVLQYIDEQGLELAGDIIGNLLFRAHEAECYMRYIETWIPVKRKI